MKKTALSKDIFLIDQFWSINKCDEFIAKSESKGYEAATVQTETGPRVVDHIRNNNRVLYKDGVPLAILAGGEVRFLEEIAPEQEWPARNALLRRQVPPTLALLG